MAGEEVPELTGVGESFCVEIGRTMSVPKVSGKASTTGAAVAMSGCETSTSGVGSEEWRLISSRACEIKGFSVLVGRVKVLIGLRGRRNSEALGYDFANALT